VVAAILILAAGWDEADPIASLAIAGPSCSGRGDY
jgi:Co/Zn/Cd efflux system component